MQALNAQSVFNETFTGSTAAGWVFKSGAGDVKPFLTAGTGSNGDGTGSAIDTAGNGWLRLTEDIQNQSTSALLDTQIFSVNAKIEIEMEYAFYSKGASTGADGISFFLVDGSVDSANFIPGAYGGSMGYAQKTNEAGMAGGYLGFGFDTFGNYTNNDEGRVGGRETGLEPNRVAVRGPASSDWAFIAESADLDTIDFNGAAAGGTGQFMANYDSATRPDQSGQYYRQFKITLDANNQLTVDMRFGVGNAYVTVFTADLSGYERPDTFKIGFTGATGDAYGIHEIRQVSVTTTPWSSGSGAYEWDNGIPGTGTTAWGTGTNWDTNNTPTAKSDVLFGNKPTNNGATNSQQVQLSAGVEVRNMTFDSGINYTIGESSAGAGNQTITFGKNSAGVGLPSINVNNYNDAYARHKINANVNLLEDIAIRNYSYSTLCINGTITTNGNDITTSGYGATNLNGAITGSGDLTVNGSVLQGTGAGIVTISGANTTWSGDVTVNGGQLVVLGNDALGSTSTSIGSIATRNGVSTAVITSTTGLAAGQLIDGNAGIPDGTSITAVRSAITKQINTSTGSTSATVSSATGVYVGQLVTGTGIPANTYITAISGTTITLSNAATNGDNTNRSLSAILELSGNATSTATGTASAVTLYGTTVNNGGTLTFRGGVTTREPLTINGTGTTLGRGELGGALYNDGGDNTLSGPVTLGSNSAVRSRDGNLTLSGVVSGAYSLTKTGDGVVTLSGANTYSGATIVQGGALRVTSATALSSNSNLQLAGGVLEIAGDLNGGTTGDYSQSLGTGGTNLRFTGDGGFSASGGNRTVNIGNGSTLTWASTANFLGTNQALLLSSAQSDSTITLANEIRLNGAVREIRVADGSAAEDAIITGRLRNENSDTTAGAGGIRKTGDGTLVLSRSSNATNSRNYYGGDTIIEGGALRFEGAGALSPVTQIELAGGVAELGSTYSTYTASLGSADGNVRWAQNKDGGFSAYGADTTVTLNNSTTAIAWGAANFVDSGYALVLGSKSANATLIWDKGLSLAGATQTIRVVDGVSSFTGAEGRISQAIANGTGTGSLKVAGNGRLDLTAANTYTGDTTVIGSEVRLNGASGSLASTSITVQQGGRLTLDNGSATNAGRLADNAAVSLNGGTLSLIGRSATGADITETIGSVTLSGGANTIDLARSNSDSFIRLAASSLARSSTSAATVNFTNTGGAFGGDDTGNNPRVTFSTAPTALIDDGILAFATINGTDFATHGANGIVAATYATNNLAQGSWNLTTNYTGNSATAVDLTASANLNSLRLVDGADINLGVHQLTIDSGGILTTGAGGTTISGTGILTTNNSKEFVVHAYNTGGTTISATIGGSGGLTKSGTGTLTLSGSNQNTNTGKTTVNEGTLVLAKSANTTAIAGDLVIGDGRGQDIVRIDANEQIANSATVTLRGGERGNSANVASLVFADANGSITESFGTLKIEGNTVLDFAGGNPCAPSFLYLDVLDIASDGLLTIKNWVEFTDFLLIKKVNADPDDLARIVFDGYGGAAAWKSYDSNYYQLVPYAPVPEPSTFGLLSLGGLVGFATLRRRRRA